MMEFEIRGVSSHACANHKTCSDLEKVKECISEALQFLSQHRDSVIEITGALEYMQVCIHLQRANQFITQAIQTREAGVLQGPVIGLKEEMEVDETTATVSDEDAVTAKVEDEEFQLDAAADVIAVEVDETVAAVTEEDAATAKVEVQLDAAAADVIAVEVDETGSTVTDEDAITAKVEVEEDQLDAAADAVEVNETAATVTDEDAATVTVEDAATVTEEDAAKVEVEEDQLDAADVDETAAIATAAASAAKAEDDDDDDDAADGYHLFHSGGADPHRAKLGPTQQNASSLSTGIKAEMLQEQEGELDAAPVLWSEMMASPPDLVSLFQLKRLSVRLVDCRAGQQETNSKDGGKTKTEKTNDCKQSGKGFSEAGRPRKDHRIHTAEKRHPCQQPRKRHRNTAEKRHPCEHCGKRFSAPSKLRVHLVVHTGERPYHCAQCGKRFSHAFDLQRHQRIHTGDRPFHCEQCGKSFSRAENLRVHQRRHTGEKPYHCGQCGKYFTQPADLQRHQRIHTGEKPYQCPTCDKRFVQAIHLKRHLDSQGH